MHNLRAGANSAWACSVLPNPVSSVGRPMAPGTVTSVTASVVPELNSTTTAIAKTLKNPGDYGNTS
jgi:hypothetical protein